MNRAKRLVLIIYISFSEWTDVLQKKLLSGHGRLTPIIPNLSEEVDKRLWDKNIYEQFWKDDKEKKLRRTVS
ncbi:hypothetical protein [Ruminococcus albus]|uniref:hypothetical protein n=1 Tax=Ruminococcus albus TaxID=1264 RepID=UPI001D133FA7|nr:hypothetical protein [Ruminococcus albus]MCC3352092.1 hypothetical protein [Ruminococcus albus 8]